MKQIKVKGLYEPARESVEGFVLTYLKSNSYKMFVLRGGGGGEGRAVSSQSRVAVSREGFKKKDFMVVELIGGCEWVNS